MTLGLKAQNMAGDGDGDSSVEEVELTTVFRYPVPCLEYYLILFENKPFCIVVNLIALF